MTDGGWFGDPTGRFGQRYYDGSAWTKHVVGASGDVIEDALPDSDTPYPAPAQQAAEAPAQPAPPAYQAPQAPASPPAPQYPSPQYPAQAGGGYRPPAGPYGAPGGPAPVVRYGIGAGLFIGLVGVALVALSLFALSWAPGDKSRFTDLSSNLRKLNSPTFPNVGYHLYYLYGAWLGYVLLAAVLVLVILAGIPVPPTGVGNRIWRIIASLLAGIAAVLHSMTLTYVFTNTGRSANFGSVLALIGYGVVMIAMIVGARRIVRPPGRPY